MEIIRQTMLDNRWLLELVLTACVALAFASLWLDASVLTIHIAIGNTYYSYAFATEIAAVLLLAPVLTWRVWKWLLLLTILLLAAETFIYVPGTGEGLGAYLFKQSALAIKDYVR